MPMTRSPGEGVFDQRAIHAMAASEASLVPCSGPPLSGGTCKRLISDGDVNQMVPPRDISPQFLSLEGFHPEFGYLCPAPRMRRKIRTVSILVSIGMMVVAISVLARMNHEDGEDVRWETVLPAAALLAADRASTSILPPLAAPGSCRDLPGMFLHHPRCESDKRRAARSRRGAFRQIVSLPIGHRGIVSANEPAEIVAKVARSEDKTSLGTVTNNAKAPSARLSDSAGSGKKRATKIARRNKSTPPGENGLNAFAAAPWLESYPRNREATPWNWGAWHESGGFEPKARWLVSPPRK
jgi:hypothetical protein